MSNLSAITFEFFKLSRYIFEFVMTKSSNALSPFSPTRGQLLNQNSDNSVWRFLNKEPQAACLFNILKIKIFAKRLDRSSSMSQQNTPP